MSGPHPVELRLRSRIAWPTVLPAIRTTARVAWRLTIDRGSGFPPPPFVLASNHHSFLDAPLVGAALGSRVRFIALDDLFGNGKVIDWTLDTLEVIRLRRGMVPLAAVRECLSHLVNGGVVALFPEGTRAARFGDIDPYPGAAWLAVRAGVPLVAVAVSGTDRVLGIDNRFHRGRVKVIVGPTFLPQGSGRQAVDDLTGRWAEWVASTIDRPGLN